jgi:hypothetical protein
MIIFEHRKIKSEKSRGMKKMKKKTKIILLATMGIYLFSFMPAVVGKANSRPISDFTATNDYVANWYDPESDLIVIIHGFFVTPPGTDRIANYPHTGSVLERDLKDGRILYKVNLHVKGAWIMVAYYSQERLIFVGEMDYTIIATIILYEGVFGGPVPNFLQIWFPDFFDPPIDPPIGESTFSHITGSGTGIFVDDAAAIEQGFAPGATAKVKLSQVGISKPEDHPQIDPEHDPYNMWPVEIVFFH